MGLLDSILSVVGLGDDTPEVPGLSEVLGNINIGPLADGNIYGDLLQQQKVAQTLMDVVGPDRAMALLGTGKDDSGGGGMPDWLASLIPTALSTGVGALQTALAPDQLEINAAHDKAMADIYAAQSASTLEGIMAQIKQREAEALLNAKLNAQLTGARIAAQPTDSMPMVHAGTKAAEGKRADADRLTRAMDALIARTQAGLLRSY